MADDFKQFIRSSPLRWPLGILGALLIALLVFHAGVAVGERRGFEHMRAMNVHGTPPPFAYGGFGIPLPHGYIPEGHGVVGTISAIALPTITVHERDGESEDVLTTSATRLHDSSAAPTLKDLTLGEQVVIVGEPASATSSEALTALFIRVLPTATSTPLR